jgi:imidazolonepropionase-like amidohydrolase
MRYYLAGLLAFAAAPSQAADPTLTIYRGASVWNGSGFAKRDFAVRAGRIVAMTRTRNGPSIDVSGKFIVPAYGNAHHHITNPNPAGSWTFIEEGVFYVWNPNSIVLGTDTRDYFARRDTIDVALSQGGITEPRGHPEPLYVDTLSRYVYKGMTQPDFLGNAFHYGRTRAEIDAALRKLKGQRANFVKAYLLYSEEYDRRRSDPKYDGLRGLNPANVPYLVTAARRFGFPTYFHVETRADLLTAVRAGAAVLGHLPAYPAISDPAELAMMRLTAADAREVARHGSLVIATYGLAAEAFAEDAAKANFDPSKRDRVFAVQRDNLRYLVKAGARFMTGTDRNPAIFDEVEHWVAIGGMTTAQALIETLATGKRMFPRRRLGCFDVGCEADFLVLSVDPSKDIRGLRRIERIVKAGLTMIKPAGLNTNR